MHITEGFLPPLHCAAWFAAAAPFVVHGARAVVLESRKNPENRLLLAAAGAFMMVLSAIKLPSVTGSSSHPTGTGLGAVLFKPPVMALMGCVVLLFQALLLAHGGLTTLGANTFSMAIVGPWCGYACFVAARAVKLPTEVGIFLAMAVADLSTYVMTSLQLALAYPDASTGFVGAAGKFLGVFAVTQLPLALAEGCLGVVVYRFLSRAAASELIRRGIPAAGARGPVKEASHV